MNFALPRNMDRPCVDARHRCQGHITRKGPRFEIDPTFWDEMRRPIPASENDGVLKKRALSLPQGCVQLHEAVYSAHAIVNSSAFFTCSQLSLQGT